MQDVQAVLRELVELGGSDLHLKVGSPPRFRIDGVLQAAPGSDVLEAADTEAALLRCCRTRTAARSSRPKTRSTSPSTSRPGRFRVNAFRQRGTISLVCRAIPHHIRSIEDLHLPGGAHRSPRRSAASCCSPGDRLG